MEMIELSGEESRLRDAYCSALSNFESMAAANHQTASAPQVQEAVKRTEVENLFVLCNLSALNFARVIIPDFVSVTPKRGVFGRKRHLAEQNSLAREVQMLSDHLLAAGFIAGLAIASLRGEQLEVDTNTAIYPDPAIGWYWENASEYIWESLDADPVASNMLNTLSGGDVAILSRYADEAERMRGITPDPILSSARGELIARRGYSLYWVHTKAVWTRFQKEHFAWVARETLGQPG